MKIIKPDVQFITPIDGATILKRLEQCGRVCYKSEDKITEGSAEKFVAGIIKRGHEAVLEHCSFTVGFLMRSSATGWLLTVRNPPAIVITARASSVRKSR